MKVRISCIAATCSVLLLTALPALAHHSFPRASDATVSITGTVTKFEMRNPHSRVFLDARNADGTVRSWEIELGSVQALVGRGWQRDSVKAGDVITVEAIVGTSKDNLGAARDLTLPDGKVIFAGSHVGDKDRP